MNEAKKLRVVVADDEELVRRSIRQTLESKGHEVLEFASGRELLESDCATADLVIMDVVMPDGDGIETLTELRRSRPSLPVIAISGVGAARAYLDVMEALGATSLEKPFASRQLLDAVEASLGN